MTHLLLLGAALAADCPETVTAESLSSSLDTAEAAWAELDEYTFRDGVNGLIGRDLPCLREPLTPLQSARIHRAAALHLGLVGDEPGAEGALRAARAAEPDFSFSDDVLPSSNPLRPFYDDLDATLKTQRVSKPRSGSLLFDGQNGQVRPSQAPAVLQRLDGSGLVVETTYLGRGEAMPTYRAVPRKRNALLVTSGAALLGGIGMYGASWSSRGKLVAEGSDLSVSGDSLDGLRSRTNVLSLTSGVLFGVAIGGGVGAFVVGEQ